MSIRAHIAANGRKAMREALALTGAGYVAITGLALLWEAFQ